MCSSKVFTTHCASISFPWQRNISSLIKSIRMSTNLSGGVSIFITPPHISWLSMPDATAQPIHPQTIHYFFGLECDGLIHAGKHVPAGIEAYSMCRCWAGVQWH
jgi:hypothetical protein